MTEYELFVSCIPVIAKMIAKCQRMPVQQYDEWKQKTLAVAPEEVKSFMEKVMVVIDSKVAISQPKKEENGCQ